MLIIPFFGFSQKDFNYSFNTKISTHKYSNGNPPKEMPSYRQVKKEDDFLIITNLFEPTYVERFKILFKEIKTINNELVFVYDVRGSRGATIYISPHLQSIEIHTYTSATNQSWICYGNCIVTKE